MLKRKKTLLNRNRGRDCMVNAQNIVKHLTKEVEVFAYDVIPSTNDEARRHLAKHTCDRAVFVARGQTAGKGRLGRSFYSPVDTGIYMTYVFRVRNVCNDIVRVTTAASVAVAKALNCGAKIKWVNDLYLGGKKICGILTEIVKNAEYNYIMIGIGINLTTTDFPDDIQYKAGAIGVALDKDRIIAAICDNLSQVADTPFASDYLGYYRKHMLGIGEMIAYVENGQEHMAMIEGISDLGELLVIEENTHKRLCSGEITIISVEAVSR